MTKYDICDACVKCVKYTMFTFGYVFTIKYVKDVIITYFNKLYDKQPDINVDVNVLTDDKNEPVVDIVTNSPEAVKINDNQQTTNNN